MKKSVIAARNDKRVRVKITRTNTCIISTFMWKKNPKSWVSLLKLAC